MALTESELLAVAGDRIYARGEDYVRYVRGLRTTPPTATASVQAKRVYDVHLDWSGPQPHGSCTCPHAEDGHFCKHLVAVGLSVIDSGAVDDTVSVSTALAETVQAMSVDELRELVLAMAQRDGEIRRVLEMRASAATGDDTTAKAEFETYVRTALEFHGFVDYRESYAVAQDAGRVLDELERHIDDGAAEVVRPALRCALEELRDVAEQSDDSSGVIGAECQRAADLYVQACRLGRPDPIELAEWLVSFRASSPGWPTLVLADFVDVFDATALQLYRLRVEELGRSMADREPWRRSEVDAMLLELADHDGDIDRAVRLLNDREHPRYGEIIDRLQEAGRNEEAVIWMDHAVADGRVRSRGVGSLNPANVARTYLEYDRLDDAIAVMRADFVTYPTVESYRSLIDFGASIGREDVEHSWVFEHTRELADRHGDGAVLVRLLVGDGDVDGAWEAADTYGPGGAWEELAVKGAEARPIAAADLYRPKLDADLQHANTRRYPDIAKTLETMRELYEKGCRTDDFAVFIATIRRDYRRRTSLMWELDRKRL